MFDEKSILKVLYTNWQGMTALRNIIPYNIYLGSNEWHTETQLLLRCHDVEKDKERIYALNGIKLLHGNCINCKNYIKESPKCNLLMIDFEKLNITPDTFGCANGDFLK